MNKFLIFFLFAFQLSFAQVNVKPSTYKYGHDGMEMIISSRAETIKVSTFNAKATIKKTLLKNYTTCIDSTHYARVIF